MRSIQDENDYEIDESTNEMKRDEGIWEWDNGREEGKCEEDEKAKRLSGEEIEKKRKKKRRKSSENWNF